MSCRITNSVNHPAQFHMRRLQYLTVRHGISYTDVHYIDYPTNTFNALKRCISLFVDALRISQYFQSCQVFLSSWFEPVPSRG